MDPCCIVLNPAARTARKLGVASQLSRIAPNAVLRITQAPGHAEALAREAVALGFRTVVAGGGDGTVNEVLRGLAGADVRFGVLPLGTMNVFARELKLPLDWPAAWHRIALGGERRVDVGSANGIPFAQLAGVGFDAQALARVDPRLKQLFGPLAYLWAGLRTLAQPLPQLTVHAEGRVPLHAEWVLLGTGRYYGGPFPVFPNAKNGDGLLNVLVLQNLSMKCLLTGMLALPLGLHPQMAEVACFQTTHLRVEMKHPETEHAEFELDGERIGPAPVDFRVAHNALRIAV